MLDIHPFTLKRLADLEELFRSDRSASSCWCMWFIIRVKDYHLGGSIANGAKFKALAESSAHPLGLIAHFGDRPVGWVAVGPRSRYVRAVRTPTMKGIDHSKNDEVWLVPCFFIRPDMRGKGFSRLILERAVDLARKSNASAIEGFPTAGVRRGSTDPQVGTEHLFESCGFRPISRPSSNRVLMRLDL